MHNPEGEHERGSFRSLVVLFFTLIALATCVSASSLPRIRILATGGTIAGAQSHHAGNGYKSGALSIDELIRAVPQAGRIAEISTEQVCNIGSQTMTDAVWLKLANRVNQVLQDSKVDAVVITHGTDTLEETAYFLNLVVKSEKPIVMSGAMRPATAISADGPANLFNAIAVAANPQARGRGVLVVLNDEIHYAREVQKYNTTRLDSLESRDRGPAGLMSEGHAIFFSAPTGRHGLSSEFSLDGLLRFPRVEIVYSYANLGRNLIDDLVAHHVRGIVLAGVGDGNTTDEALAGLRDAAKRGVAIVRSTRVDTGITQRNIEINDDQMGFIASGELNPQKARVLLMLGLTKTNDAKKLQTYFDQY